MTWRLAKSLQVLRAEVDRLAPARRKAYDGTIGDAAHAARPSAHNPNDAGVVCALDLTHDPDGGLDCESLFEHLRTHPHKDLRYIIHNRKRAARPVWAVGKYAGDNPHKTHIHITVGTGSDSEPLPPYDDLDPWLTDWGNDMTPDEVRAIVREEVDVIYSGDVKAAQDHLVKRGLLSKARDPQQAASVGLVALLISRALKILGQS